MVRVTTSNAIKMALFTLLIGVFVTGVAGCETGYEQERFGERGEALEGEGLEEREEIEEEGIGREVERDD